MKMIHNPIVTILVQFLWPFNYALLILRGEDQEFSRNQRKSRIATAWIVIHVYKKCQHNV